MLEKNPYENGVDIPDFVETKEDDIDMSVFKMSNDEANLNTSPYNQDEYDYEDDDDDEPKRQVSFTGVLAIVAVALLITTVLGLVFGFSQKSKVKEALAQVETLKTEINSANEKVTALQNEITVLKSQTEQNNNSSAVEPTGDSKEYKVVSTSGIRVRPSAGASGASYAKEADVKGLKDVNVNEGVVMISNGAIVNVYETSEVNGATWGRIVNGKDVWICLKMADGSVLAKAQ